MSIASEFAFERMFGVFLASLQNISFTGHDGWVGVARVS
jgi:hypothetical protein